MKTCAKNGVKEIVEVKIGYDGIVIANSKKSKQMKISLRQVFLALAKMVPEGGKEGGKLVPNPYKTWSQIDPSLPNVRIEVLGPLGRHACAGRIVLQASQQFPRVPIIRPALHSHSSLSRSGQHAF